MSSRRSLLSERSADYAADQVVDERTSLLSSSNRRSEQLLTSGSSSASLSHQQQHQQQQQNRGGISWYFAVFLIVNAALGAGLLNYGKSFDQAGGILISSVIQIVLVIIICGSLIIMAYCTDTYQSATYQDVIMRMCGKRWQMINAICILLYTYGTCITYFIVIGDQLDQSRS
jgi:sodium-coupled neutral amino acid transporter 7/8